MDLIAMKRFLLAFLLSLLIPSGALAQCNGVFANNTVCGNNTGTSNTPRAISPAALLGAAGGSNGQVQVNNAGVLGGLTNTQLTALINSFSSTLSGVVPSSGGGTTNFLRADGSFAVPPGTGVTSVTIAGTAGTIAVSGTCTITTTGTCTLDLVAGRKTLPTISLVTGAAHSGGFSANASGTYTTPANVLWIEVERSE